MAATDMGTTFSDAQAKAQAFQMEVLAHQEAMLVINTTGKTESKAISDTSSLVDKATQ